MIAVRLVFIAVFVAVVAVPVAIGVDARRSGANPYTMGGNSSSRKSATTVPLRQTEINGILLIRVEKK